METKRFAWSAAARTHRDKVRFFWVRSMVERWAVATEADCSGEIENKPMNHRAMTKRKRENKTQLTCDELVEKRIANCCIFGTKILL